MTVGGDACPAPGRRAGQAGEPRYGIRGSHMVDWRMIRTTTRVMGEGKPARVLSGLIFQIITTLRMDPVRMYQGAAPRAALPIIVRHLSGPWMVMPAASAGVRPPRAMWGRTKL